MKKEGLNVISFHQPGARQQKLAVNGVRTQARTNQRRNLNWGHDNAIFW